MSRDTKVFATREASLVADVKWISRDLELAKESHSVYVVKTDSKILCLEELQLVKADQYSISKDLDKARNEKVLLHNQ